MPRRDKNVRASAAKRQRLSAIAPDDFEDLDEAGWLEVPPPQGLPPGPSTADELQQWPLDLVRRLVGYNNCGAMRNTTASPTITLPEHPYCETWCAETY